MVFDGRSNQQSQVATANASVGAPGAQLAGAVALEGIEIRDEQRQRTLAVELQRAMTPGDRAAIVATATREADDRLNALKRELRQLRSAHQAGQVSDDRYEAERATITADARGIERTLDLLRPVAVQLPARVLDDRTTVQTIDRLSDRANAIAAGNLNSVIPAGDENSELSPDETTAGDTSRPPGVENESSEDGNDNDDVTESVTDSGDGDDDVDDSEDDDDNSSDDGDQDDTDDDDTDGDDDTDD